MLDNGGRFVDHLSVARYLVQNLHWLSKTWSMALTYNNTVYHYIKISNDFVSSIKKCLNASVDGTMVIECIIIGTRVAVRTIFQIDIVKIIYLLYVKYHKFTLKL